MTNNYVLWCTYHNENIIKEYNLYETEKFKLFYNDNFYLKEDNINYLHNYVGDIVTYYYVWKNNKKSNIVGFCQYRRHFIDINYDIINKCGYYNYYGTFMNNSLYHEMNYLMSDYYINCFLTYMYEKYNVNLINKMNQYHYMSWHNIYFFNWETFCDVCDFIFGFFEYLLPNQGWKNIDNLEFLCKMNMLKNENDFLTRNNYELIPWWDRFLSVVTEDLIGIYLAQVHGDNIINSEKYYKYILCEDYINDINQLETWYKYNIKSGIRNFVVKSTLDINKINTFKELNIFLYTSEDQLYNIINNELNDLEQIKLHSNERINCENGIEFHNNKYTIEQYK